VVCAPHELRLWLAPTYLALGRDDFNADLTLKQGRPTRRAERLVGELIEFAEWRRYKAEKAASGHELQATLTVGNLACAPDSSE